MRRLAAALAVASVLAAFAYQQPKTPPSPPRVNYVDLAARAGLTARSESGGDKAKKWIVETTGSGAAAIDYDNDGWLDAFLVNATTFDKYAPGQEPTSHLYRNNHDGTFTDVTKKSGTGLIGWGQGVCAGDYDNDGWVDLFVTFWGHNVLLRNGGAGAFTDMTRKSGLWGEEVRWGSGCAFLDYNRDGRLDLFISEYVGFDPATTPTPGATPFCQWKGMPVMCGPRGLKGTRSWLYRNNGDGTFADVSAATGVAQPEGYYCFTSLTGDFDNDGWPDVYVACDSTPSMLFHNNGNGTFTEIAVRAGVAYNEDGHEQAGMGAHAMDYDGDGRLDIVKTNFSDDTATLYHNNGNGTFTDVTLAAGLGSNRHFLGWGVVFLDVDQDGWPDIFMANGHVYPEVDNLREQTTFRERKVLYWNSRDGKFRDISTSAGPGINAKLSSRGVAVADFDNDGTPEILINNMHDPPSLLKNLGDKKNWLTLKLTGSPSNRDAIGARVVLRSGGRQQVQEVRSGGGYNSQSDFRLYFGLGDATTADVEIRWPSGAVEKAERLAANRLHTLREGFSKTE